MLPCVYKNRYEKVTFFLENCVELCVLKMRGKLGKIHIKWVIFWNNVKKIIALKKLHTELVVCGIITKKIQFQTISNTKWTNLNCTNLSFSQLIIAL